MTKIRLTTIENIKIKLDNTIFSRYLFDLSVNKKDYILRIQFKGKYEYSLLIKDKIKNKKNENNRFVIIQSPGELITEVEKSETYSIKNAIESIEEWVERIEEDYILEAPKEELDELRKKIFDHIDKSNIDDSYFSDKEQIKVNEKINNLEEKITILYKEKEATKKQVDAMHKQMKILKMSIEILDKRTWFSAAYNRVFDIYKEVKGAKNEVSDLLDDMQNLLPSNSNENIISEVKN